LSALLGSVAHVSVQGQGHKLRSTIIQSNIRHYVLSALYVLHKWKDFLTVKYQILNKQILNIMSCPLYKTYTNGRIFLWCAKPMLPMCQLKVEVTVKSQILNKQIFSLWNVRVINPIPMKGFPSNLNDTFTSIRWCAEPMLPMCQLKVEITVKCQTFYKQIFHIMSWLLYNSFTNGRISFKLEWHIHLNKGRCIAHVVHVLAQGQGHS